MPFCLSSGDRDRPRFDGAPWRVVLRVDTKGSGVLTGFATAMPGLLGGGAMVRARYDAETGLTVSTPTRQLTASLQIAHVAQRAAGWVGSPAAQPVRWP